MQVKLRRALWEDLHGHSGKAAIRRFLAKTGRFPNNQRDKAVTPQSRKIDRKGEGATLMTAGEWGVLIGLGFGISTGFWAVERKLNEILGRLSVHD